MTTRRDGQHMSSAVCTAEFEALTSEASNMTTPAMEVAFRGLLTKVAQEQVGAQVRVTGEGRVTAHTWRASD